MEESFIQIISGTIKNEQSIDYTYSKKIQEHTDTIKVSGTNRLHWDLMESFDNLIPHFVLLTEQVPEGKIQEVKDIMESGFPPVTVDGEIHWLKMKYKVHSFKVSGKEESEKVELLGVKNLEIGETISISTPKIKYESESYEFSSDLSLAIEHCKSEIHEYLNGKFSPDNQITMAFSELVDEEEQEELQQSA